MPIWEDVDARQHAHKERDKVVLLLLHQLETIPKRGQTDCLMKSIFPQKEESVEALRQIERECCATKRSVCPRFGMVSVCG